MFCEKCGMELEADAVFCEKCGAKVSNDEAINLNQNNVDVSDNIKASTSINASNNFDFSKWTKDKRFWGVLSLVIICMLLIIISMSQPKKLNLNEYISVEFEGYNSIGTANINIDSDGIEAKLAEIMKLEPKDDSFIGELLSEEPYEEMQKILDCEDLFEVSIDKSDALTNGDVVTLSFEIDNETAKEYNVRYVGKETEYVVEGLEDIEIIDAFADFTVEFQGISPQGEFIGIYNGSNEYLSSHDFEVDSNYKLRNGDIVQVNIDVDEEYLASQGYALKEISRSYTVEGLDEYILSYDSLSEDFLDYAKQEAQDVIISYIAKHYDEEVNTTELVYSGYVFDAPKADAEWYSNYNNLYLIYTSDVSHTEGKFDTTKIYFPVRIFNILSTKEKGITCEISDSILGNVKFTNSRYSSNGYTNPFVAYMDLIEYDFQNYDIIAGDGFEKYMSYTLITSLSEIPDSGYRIMEEIAKTIVNSYVENGYNEHSHISDLNVLGYYLLKTKKQDESNVNTGKVYIICSATASNDKGKFIPATVYYPVLMSGLYKLSTDEFVYTYVDDKIAGYTDFPNSYYSTRGYLDGKQMFNDLINANRSEYTYEISDGLKTFGE